MFTLKLVEFDFFYILQFHFAVNYFRIFKGVKFFLDIGSLKFVFSID